MVKPREQIGLILPTLVTGLLCLLVGYAVLSAFRFAAFEALQNQNVGAPVLKEFLDQTRFFFFVFWGLSVLFFLGGTAWAVWASLRIFGPLYRLESDLASILKGEQKFLNLKIRKGDALRTLFEQFDRFLSRPRS